MSEENLEVVRRMLEALTRGDVEGAIETADTPPEFEFVPSGVLIPDLASVQRGPEAFRRINEWFWGEFDDPHVEVHELIDAGDVVFSSVTASGRGKQSGVETTCVRSERVDRAGRPHRSLAGIHGSVRASKPAGLRT